MNAPTTLDYITAVGAVVTPILVLFLTAIGWTIKNRFDAAREREEYWRDLENKLHQDRLKIYHDILEPFIIALTPEHIVTNDKAYRGKTVNDIVSSKMLSLAYKEHSFKLSLMGSDNVVRAFNNIMQYFYAKNSSNPPPEKSPTDETKELVHLVGTLLLEIRRSVGNEKTTIDTFEMLEWLITDIRSFRN